MKKETLQDLIGLDGINIETKINELIVYLNANQNEELIEEFEIFFTYLCLLDIKKNKNEIHNLFELINKNKKLKSFLMNKLLNYKINNKENKNINDIFLKLDILSKKYFRFFE